MSAQAIAVASTRPSHLRAFDPRRDLLAVANLVELCFAETLDADGRLYIEQMRHAARGGLFVGPNGRAELPLGGYVWLEDGELVGNLSLIPQRAGTRKLYLIANVAVHPRYRMRGIARALTNAALQEVQRRGLQELWLQVDEKNPAAVSLYQRMGFAEQLRRTSWRLQPQTVHFAGQSAAQVRPRRGSDWPAQNVWLLESYPRDVRWQLPLDLDLLQTGWRGSLARALSERQVMQWSAEHNGELLGVLSWQSSSLEADRLWLAAAPEREAEAIPVLLHQAHAHLQRGRLLALNYPKGRAEDALTAAGFYVARTLIWMNYPWKRGSEQ